MGLGGAALKRGQRLARSARADVRFPQAQLVTFVRGEQQQQRASRQTIGQSKAGAFLPGDVGLTEFALYRGARWRIRLPRGGEQARGARVARAGRRR